MGTCHLRLKMDSTMNISRSVDTMSMINQSISAKDSLDLSGKMLDRFFAADDSFPTLLEKMQITKNSQYHIIIYFCFCFFNLFKYIYMFFLYIIL